jgi:hypothetical protein
MTSISKLLKLFTITVLLFNVSSCSKPAGPGGKAVVKGKVYAHDFDNTQRYVLSKGYAAGERVYISYGNSNSIGNDVRTASDGSFEFMYLTKGHYKIFVMSLDTSIKFKGNDTEKAVIKEFDITDTKQTVTLEDIIINK